MAADPKDVVRDYYRSVWEEAETAAIPRLFSPGYVNHAGARGTLKGPEGIAANYRSLRDAFPDVRFTLDILIAEGSKVCAYYTMTGTHEGPFQSIAPTGRRVSVPGIGIYEVRDGMIVESWVVRDSLVLLRQLEAGPDAKG